MKRVFPILIHFSFFFITSCCCDCYDEYPLPCNEVWLGTDKIENTTINKGPWKVNRSLIFKLQNGLVFEYTQSKNSRDTFPYSRCDSTVFGEKVFVKYETNEVSPDITFGVLSSLKNGITHYGSVGSFSFSYNFDSMRVNKSNNMLKSSEFDNYGIDFDNYGLNLTNTSYLIKRNRSEINKINQILLDSSHNILMVFQDADNYWILQ